MTTDKLIIHYENTQYSIKLSINHQLIIRTLSISIN